MNPTAALYHSLLPGGDITKRQPLDDGHWFNKETAIEFAEASYGDGRNHISRATGSPLEHETLYRTASGRWVLNHWSPWQGPTWTEISNESAARWLSLNEHEPLECCELEYAALEV